jgi:hypothetical protein
MYSLVVSELGIQEFEDFWIPVFTGMTGGGAATKENS